MIFHSPIAQRITQSLASAPNRVLVYIRQQNGSPLGFGHTGVRRTSKSSEISIDRIETHQLDLDQTYKECIDSIYICQIDPKYLLALLGSKLAAHPHACPRSKFPMVRHLQSEGSTRDCIQDSYLSRCATRQYSDECEGSLISHRSVHHQGALFFGFLESVGGVVNGAGAYQRIILPSDSRLFAHRGQISRCGAIGQFKVIVECYSIRQSDDAGFVAFIPKWDVREKMIEFSLWIILRVFRWCIYFKRRDVTRRRE